MLAYQWYPFAGFFEIDAVLDTVQFKVDIAPDDV
jgi:hypothetical protein